jgi:HK97 family phage prohead protease
MERTAPKCGVPQARDQLGITFERDGAQAEGGRRRSFVASDESVDRYGDIIRASGWQLDAYRTNPQLLFAHQSRQLPVGRVVDIAVDGTRLIAHAEFAPEGLDATGFADTVWRFVEAGFLKAVSVGFAPTKVPNEIKDPVTNAWTGGFEFVGQELLELSVCTVPANPNALQLARDLKLAPETLRELFAPEDASRAAEAAVAAAHQSRTITLARLGR